ncbi:Arm DNA-binding domain-containing protein [Xanthobacter wiegelii]|uniref:Arm DNA-binding domain-containing protein n=1 Tax=Xanthobacter wiegelii TaxID=3119913 RepID=UPI003735B77C
MKYRYDGKEKLLALGAYPIVTLAKARGKRDEAKAQTGGRHRSRQIPARIAHCGCGHLRQHVPPCRRGVSRQAAARRPCAGHS